MWCLNDKEKDEESGLISGLINVFRFLRRLFNIRGVIEVSAVRPNDAGYR